MRKFAPHMAIVAAVLAYAGVASAQNPRFDPISFRGPDPTERFRDVSIEQNLDAQVPLDLTFVDEHGESVRLGDYLGDRPVLLALVYYECPMLCNLMLNGVEAVIDAMKFEIGTDYDVVAVSIDPGETPELARQKKAAHLERLGRPGAEDGWHFLTGDEENIEVLASTVGFRYVYDPATDQYVHAAGIMALTPTGRVARYFYGTDYIARDVEFGLTQASQGTIGSIVDKFVLLCYAYDPATGTYGFYVIGAVRLFSGLMIAGFLLFWTWLYFRGKKAGAPAVPGNGPSPAH